MNRVTVDIVSDVMCPWCYIGKRRFEQAIALLGDDAASVEHRWRPYQLDPTLPPEGRDRREYLERKFGGPERARQIYAAIESAGRDEGIDFAFDRIERSPNTLDAHRVLRWAAGQSSETQDRLKEALLHAFFAEGVDISKHDVLADLAASVGMDRSVVADLLSTDRDVAETEAEIAEAQTMGVTGVPTFILNGRYAVTGAQDPATLAQAIRQVAAER